MKIVSPYRPFPPESSAHRKLGPFDWIGALQMLATSARASSQCDTYALTDVDTTLPVPAYQYRTTHRRLMLWILEVCLRYLESDDFDEDTVMVCPDILVLGDLRPFFQADLGVIVRLDAKYVEAERPLLNSVQWWRVEAKDRLVAFYQRALAIAEGLVPALIEWGADTVPLVELLSPLEHGVSQRAGLSVFAVDQREAMAAFSSSLLRRLGGPRSVVVPMPLLDFKYGRKLYMRAYFEAAFRQGVAS